MTVNNYLQAAKEQLGRGDLNEGLTRENFDFQWEPIAQDRSSAQGYFEDDLDQRPRQGRLQSEPSSSKQDFYPNKREVSVKSKASAKSQKINAEATNEANRDSENRPDRDCKFSGA